MTDLKQIQRDIETSLEGNRLDWLHLARNPLTDAERHAVKRSIHTRTEILHALLERKWELQKKARS